MSYDTAQNGTANGIPLGSQIEIIPSQPLPEFNSTGGNAYAARSRFDAASSYFAIICQSTLPPRSDMAQIMRNIDSPGIIRLVDSGVITWMDGTRAFAFVYQRPVAPRMFATINETHTPLSEDAVHQHFITPMINSLVVLNNYGIVHNGIRPTNIFWRIGNASPPQIGECLSSPAGMGQPILFEPVERALASPLGRGMGLPADDCYAFGVTLALMVIGRNPLQDMDDAAIIDLKMQRGSFGALIGNHRLSTTHIELLRGLLADDSNQRWSANDLEQWLNGRRMTPKSSDAGKRSSRHFDFGGKEYWQIAPLALALSGNVAEAAKVIENESLHKWLRRAMNDEDRAHDVERVIHDLKSGGKATHYEDQLVTRVCIALSPSLPIRYRGISAMPTGIAALLAETSFDPQNLPALAEIIASQLVTLWIQMQKDGKGDFISLGQAFERMKGIIEKASFGNGIERVTYELNPGLPCQSPILRGQYVTTPKMMMAALERIAGAGNRPKEAMDRHIAAFLIVRDKRSDSFFSAMMAPEGSLARGLGLLNLYAEMQNRHGPENLPSLAGWLSSIVDPALRRFLSKALRDHLKKQAQETIKSGNLSSLLRLVDDQRRMERDRQDFIAARLLYLNTQKEINAMEAKINNRESVVRGAGKPMAASISSFLALILICAAVLRALLGALIQ